MNRKERFDRILEYFEKHLPFAETELHYSDPYQLIVAVILSAQCTDKRVNLITPSFFGSFPDAESLSKAGVEEVTTLIRSCSYPNNKARHLIGMARMVVEEFGGIIPDDMNMLLKLPGVGRKSANVIEAVVFHKPAMAVDTHVFRVSARLGLTVNSRTPLETERQLVKYIPERKIAIAHHWLILHGRYVCQARKPKCPECGLKDWCKYFRGNKT